MMHQTTDATAPPGPPPPTCPKAAMNTCPAPVIQLPTITHRHPEDHLPAPENHIPAPEITDRHLNITDQEKLESRKAERLGG
eukprot:7983234-Alexandrium_andersonii.AAC.1